MAPRSPEREVLLYEILGEIFLLLWCEYSANQPPAAVIFEPTTEPILPATELSPITDEEA